MRSPICRSLFLMTLLLGGCAAPMAAPDGDVQRRVDALQRTQQDLSRRLENLTSEVTDLRQRISSQQQMIATLQRQPVAEKDTGRSEMTESAPRRPEPNRLESASIPPTSATELYLAAFSDYASGRYSQAIAGFRKFLDVYPTNEYAGNAQFWIGECYYAQQDYEQAAAAFRRVAENFPNAARASEALFKAATALQRQGRPDQAEEMLTTLRQRYPESDAAKKAAGSF